MDWCTTVRNALWIAGLALGLAAIGIAHDQAQGRLSLLWRTLGSGFGREALALGLAVFCVGMLLEAVAWWEYAGWGAVTAALAADSVCCWRRRRRLREAGPYAGLGTRTGG